MKGAVKVVHLTNQISSNIFSGIVRPMMMLGVALALTLAGGAVVAQPATDADGYYLLDGFGTVHTVGAAQPLFNNIFYGFDIARDLDAIANETDWVSGYYYMNGFGDQWAIGDATQAVNYPWFGWDIAKDLEIAVDFTLGTNAYTGYWVLDGYGGVHPVPLTGTGNNYIKTYANSPSSPAAGEVVWFGWDIARDLEVSVLWVGATDSQTNQFSYRPRANGYFILDGWGAVHSSIVNETGYPMDPAWFGSPVPYFPGFDIARAFEMTASQKGFYLLDGYGAVHRIGDAGTSFPTGSQSTPVFGWDIARDLALVQDPGGQVTGYYVLDGLGIVNAAGDAQLFPTSPFFGWDIARDIEVDRAFRYVTDAVVTGP